ncbi:MAG: AAA family ATPase [Micrococcaceae bacterium]
MKPLTVATTLNPRFDHVTSIESVRGNVLVTHRCDDLPELISVARSGLVDLVLIAGDTEDVGRNALESIRAQGARPPALAVLSDVSTERDRLESLGIAVNTPEIESGSLVSWLAEVAREHRDREQAGEPGTRQTPPSDEPAEPWTVDDDALPGAGQDPQDKPEEQPRQLPGKITAVWGPIGSPGRTTISVNLAAELGLAGEDVLLIDADTYGASVAAMLGLLDDSAGIAQACRAAERADISGTRLKALAAPIRVAGTRIDVLTGLTRPDRWPELRSTSLAQVLRRTTEQWSHVVIDCGFGLEEDEELSFDVPAPQRNGATLTALAAADRVLALGTGDPVGLPRLIKGLDELERAMGAQSQGHITPVINKMSASTSGVSPRAQIRSVWNRYGSHHEIHAFLPHDSKAVSNALFGGQVLAESAPKSSFRTAISALAQRVRTDTDGSDSDETRTGVTAGQSESERRTLPPRRRRSRDAASPVSKIVNRFSRTKQG